MSIKTKGLIIKRKIKVINEKGEETYKSQLYHCKINAGFPPSHRIIQCENIYEM